MILLAFLLGLVVGVALCGALFLAACYVDARASTPPARPVERRPVAGWCDGILILGDPGDKDMRCAVGGSDAQGWWWCAPNTDGIVEGCPTVDAAKLAAEDAAADLMRAGLAVLGRVK